MKKYQLFILVFFLLCFSQSNIVLGQEIQSIDYNNHDNKGKFFIFWGWNWDVYTNSDISFRGDNYDFVLSKVVAQDRQTAWDPDIYLNPHWITIPQTNFKIGYFISDHFNLSIGVDHMKYVMNSNQTVKINGSISIPGSPYEGVYNNEDIVVTPDFLLFEHTDGLNYLNVELTRFDDVLKLLKRGKKNLEINLIEGVGVGALMPRTNATLLGNERHDEFHLAGYGLDLKVGVNITFYKYFFIQGELKGGFIHMPDIRTTQFKADRASQAFMFSEADFLFGAKFRIGNKHKHSQG